MGKAATKPISSLSERARRTRNQKCVRAILSRYHKLNYSRVKNDHLNSCVDYQSSEIISESCVANRRPRKKSLLPLPSTESPLRYLSSSSDTDEDAFNDSSKTVEEVKLWSVTHNITRSACGDLLKILKKHACFESIPSDPRSLFSSINQPTFTKIGDGQLAYFGIERSITKLSKLFQDNETIKIQINIDGLPLHKSTNCQFWPILGSLYGHKHVFVIAIYCGNSKPSSLEQFLEEFVDEATKLERQGFTSNQRHYDFCISQLICDAPARSFITAIKNHSGYYSCGKCCVKGKYVEQRVVLIKTNALLRTDYDFRNRTQPSHHTGASPLERLSIDMVQDVPFEYMHLVCIGIVKKLIRTWIDGKRKRYRLRNSEKEKLTSEILRVKSCMPIEFNRKGRPVAEFERWKATELRNFLLYTGPGVLKSILRKEYYDHFMVLSVAIRLLASPNISDEHLNYAEELLLFFVQKCHELYQSIFMSYNVHGLIHLSQDVKKHGPLDNFSAFKFESFLGKLKSWVRSTKHPLQHIVNQICKREMCDKESTLAKDCPFELGPPTTCGQMFSFISLKSCRITTSFPNNIVRLRDGTVCEVSEIKCTKSKKPKLLVGVLEDCGQYFDYPAASKYFDITKVYAKKKVLSNFITYKKVQSKCVAIEIPGDIFVIFPMVHCD